MGAAGLGPGSVRTWLRGSWLGGPARGAPTLRRGAGRGPSVAVCREAWWSGWRWVLAVAAVEQVPSAWLPVAECFITQIATRLSLGEGSGGKERDEASRGGSRSLVAPSLKKWPSPFVIVIACLTSFNCRGLKPLRPRTKKRKALFLCSNLPAERLAISFRPFLTILHE